MAMVETVPWVAVIMGSKSDWEVMRQAEETLAKFDVAHECRVLSAHRTPAQTAEYVSQAESRGIEVVIAAAGGAAHLAGVCAAHTVLPVLGVPMESAALKGLDSLLSTVQMPAGIPGGAGREGAGGDAAIEGVRAPGLTDESVCPTVVGRRLLLPKTGQEAGPTWRRVL